MAVAIADAMWYIALLSGVLPLAVALGFKAAKALCIC